MEIYSDEVIFFTLRDCLYLPSETRISCQDFPLHEEKRNSLQCGDMHGLTILLCQRKLKLYMPE